MTATVANLLSVLQNSHRSEMDSQDAVGAARHLIVIRSRH
jgi:hypothetical protein